MAAGIGSRYGSLKQIDPVGPSGETILDYSIYDAIRAGFGKVVFIIRKDIEAEFKEVFLNKLSGRIEADYVFQELDKLPDGLTVPVGRVKPWGTGHALLMAKDIVKEPFAAINADDFYGADAYRVMAGHLQSLNEHNQTDFAMVGYDLNNTMSDFGSVSRGICLTRDGGWLDEVVERTKIRYTPEGIADVQEDGTVTGLHKDDVVSMNFWGFTPEYFNLTGPMFSQFIRENISNLKSEFFIPLAVDKLIKSNQARVKVLQSHDRWFGVTYKEDKPVVIEKLRELITKGIYPEKLWD